MGHFVLLYDVVDDYVERRAPLREEHLRLVREAHARGELLLAGAHQDPADEKFHGAILVFEGETPDAARRFAENDPYVKNGLVTRWRVDRWNVVVGG